MQTRLESAIEIGLNVGTGMIISWVLTMFLLPALGYQVGAGKALFITTIFTIVSVLRSYFWRRYFNRRAVTRIAHLFERPER